MAQVARKIAILTVILFAGCATEAPTPAPLDSATAIAKVESLDLLTRQILLRTDDGSLLKFRAGPNLRNLSQVRVGQRVKVSFYESQVYDIKKVNAAKGPIADHHDSEVGGQSMRFISAAVAAIDVSARTITLRSALDQTSTIRVRDPRLLHGVALGDLVTVSFIDARLLSIDSFNE